MSGERHWRAIRPQACESRTLAALSAEAERLFWRILSRTDSWGRMRGEVEIVRGTCLSLIHDTTHADDWLQELVDVGLVARYLDGDRTFLAVVNFDQHQPKELLRRRGESAYPSPLCGHSGSDPGVVREHIGQEKEKEKEKEKNYTGANAPGAETGPDSAAVQEVYDHWRRERGRTHARFTKISDRRRSKIRTRLREFTVDELKTAISAVALDPWEERARHDDLLVVLRSREQVEKFLALAETGPSPLGRRSRRGGLRPHEIAALTEAAS